MADMFYVGAYWGPRAESATDCARRLARCLSHLGAAHPTLAAWFRKGKSRSAASGTPVATSDDALEAMLLGGRNRTDVGDHVITELGFRVSLWNKSAVPVSFSTTCGAYPATTSINNYFLLELPEPSEAAAELYDPEIARFVFCSVVEAWDPEWATFASHSMRAAQGGGPGRPVGGWMTYVSGDQEAAKGRALGLPAEEFSSGILLTAGPDPRQVSDSQLSNIVEFLSP
ncbi:MULTISPECIES: Imm52 family immunity protein [unclassified Micromonospora]|uniref:Imm52 family immunity protein n=1 Tax=unclassified Micromonospora TaxID=2617518 RepID=UPI002FF032C2